MVEQDRQLGRRWYVASTKPRSEEIAHFHLVARGIEVYYPKLFLPIPNRSGRQLIPLFPNYLFVRIDVSSSEYFQVEWCQGLKKLVRFGGAPAPVENSVIDFLRGQADERGVIMARTNLKPGDEVRIAKGPLKGLVGIMQEPPGARSRVKVLMAILSREVHVEVPVDCVEIAWIAPCPV